MLWLLLTVGCHLASDDRALAVPGPVRNVLVVSIDTLRRDGLSRYGGQGDMPWLDAWFDDAVALDDHLSCSNWTYSAMICALSGATPLELGFLPLDGNGPQVWPAPVPLLAERLQDQGFSTALFSATTMLSGDLNTDRGHDTVWLDDWAPARDLLPSALGWVDTAIAGADPWYLHVHLVDPHGPYDPPLDAIPEWPGPGSLPWDLRDPSDFSDMREAWQTLNAADQAEVLDQARLLYAGELRQLDADLSAWMAQVEARGGLDDTLVLITSDHGEQFAEHGRWFHGSTLYGEEIQAIAGLQAPGLAPLAVDRPTWHTDLVPTVLAALGLPRPQEVTGEAIGLAASDRTRSVLRYDRSTSPRQLLVQDDLRLHYSWDGRDALFDVGIDPGEQDDLSDAESRETARLWDRLDEDVAVLQGLQDLYEPEPVW